MTIQEYERLKIKLKWLKKFIKNIDNEIELAAIYREIDIIEKILMEYK